tara:strand:+ start:1013 stop:1489 length:477 start_codon:yes stop_codon:yes gene_type:complete
MEQNKLLVVVRVRGEVGVRTPVTDTMNILRLYHKNYCALVWASEAALGMVKKVQDYVTFGEIDEATLIDLLKERGRIAGNKKLTAEYLKTQKLTFESLAKELISGKKKLKEVAGVKQFFRLSPPRGGFERKGIKHSFSIGGALGYRKNKINELIRRML